MGSEPIIKPSQVEPRLAATVLLLRDAAAGMEVFMVVRHHQIDFASGALVFPGGRIDPGDHDIAGNPVLFPPQPGLTAADAALRVGALRETFEECGILLARAHGDGALVTAMRLREIEETWRVPMTAGEKTFADILIAEDLVLAPDMLVPYAHWVTPLHMAKRFDTFFFLAVAPPDQVAVHDGGEAVDSIWISPRGAISEADAGTYKLVFPTQKNLEKLGRHSTPAAALDAARSAKIVTVMPIMEWSENGVRLMRIPAEADYGGDLFEVSNPPAMPD
jgi:8-oxo-dGTP pyrophosphatase MutT (NUDIX family)